MKGEERNVCCVVVRNHNRCPGGSQEPNTLKVTDVKESVTNRVHDASRYTFSCTGWYAEIRFHCCGQVVHSNRRGGRKRNNVTKERNINRCFTVRLGADARRNDCPNCKFTSDRCVLICPKKHRDDSASISDIYRYVIGCCGVHCSCGGGEFEKYRCGCHVTREKGATV